METRHLGKQSVIPTKPGIDILDAIPNPHPDAEYVVRLTCPEMTSTCPATGQPDFATLIIDYIPGSYLLESKSFKLYIFSYRNHAAFHEACTVQIGKDIRDAIKPNWIRVGGFWYPRGGIPLDIFWEEGTSGVVMIPEFGVPTYRGR